MITIRQTNSHSRKEQAMDAVTIELVAIGASVAANCHT